MCNETGGVKFVNFVKCQFLEEHFVGRSEEIQRYYYIYYNYNIYNNKYFLHYISYFLFCYNVRRDEKLTRDKIDKNDKLHSFPPRIFTLPKKNFSCIGQKFCRHQCFLT